MNIVKLKSNDKLTPYNISSDIATKNDLSFAESLSVAKQTQAKMAVDAMVKEGDTQKLDIAEVQELFGVKRNYAKVYTPTYNTSSNYVPKDTDYSSSGKASPETLAMTTEEVLKTATGSSYASGDLHIPELYDGIFEEAAQKYNVDKKFLASIAKAESNFNPNATSKAGAQGIMQLMPATAQFLGVTDAYDPYQNIMGGAKYLSSLLNSFNGNYAYAAAGYNAGGASIHKYDGLPPFTETQNYVVTVLDYYMK